MNLNKPETCCLEPGTLNIKSTVMKKTFLFRLFAITLFCMASLAIKSETSACKVECSCSANKAAVIQSSMLSDVNLNPLHHDDGFFIKI